MFTTPPVVKNLIIINVLFFMAESMLPNGIGMAISDKLALYSPLSENFHLYQIISYMFLHANTSHLFMNMFALWMFGRTLEYDLGSKRFLNYYILTGIGAGILHLGVSYLEVVHIRSVISDAASAGMSLGNLNAALINRINAATIGASGAVFGILLAFGVLHPNVRIMLLIPPIPIKAKWFVIIYGVIELTMGVASSSDGIAHFAHVGGMIFGFLLLHYWKRTHRIFF